jgi:hypothetical protein
MRGRTEEGAYLVCRQEESVIHIVLKCAEARKLKGIFLSGKWFDINEDITHNRTSK